MINNITIIIPFHDSTSLYLKRWVKFYKKYSSKITIHFLFDGYFPKELTFSDSNFYFNKTNLGKFKMIYNHIKSNNVISSHFKIVDPDDYISIKHLLKIKDLNKDYIYIFRPVFINFAHNFKQGSINRTIRKNTQNYNRPQSFGNAWTIFPTEHLKNDVFYSGKRIDFSDDQLLSYISLANGAILSNIEDKFYLYHRNNGVTKNIVDNLDNILTARLEIKNVWEQNKYYSNPFKWPFEEKWLKNKVDEEIRNGRILTSEENVIFEKIINLKIFPD